MLSAGQLIAESEELPLKPLRMGISLLDEELVTFFLKYK